MVQCYCLILFLISYSRNQRQSNVFTGLYPTQLTIFKNQTRLRRFFFLIIRYDFLTSPLIYSKFQSINILSTSKKNSR